MNVRLMVWALTFSGAALLGVACVDNEGGDSNLATGPTGASSSSGGTTSGSGSGSSGAGGSVPLVGSLDCQSYCQNVQTICTGDNLQFRDDQDCAALCDSWDIGDADDIGDNTIGCRMHYLSFAAMSEVDAVANCRFAGPHGAGKCGGSCENFCLLTQTVCTGEQAEFNSYDQCQKRCKGWDATLPYTYDATGDNFACRMSHLTEAGRDPISHCPLLADDSPDCVDPPGTGGGGGLGGGGLGGNGGMLGAAGAGGAGGN
jgi:hypothetical protein